MRQARKSRSENKAAAAEQACRAMREVVVGKRSFESAVDYLIVWMRRSGVECYETPKPLRKNQITKVRP